MRQATGIHRSQQLGMMLDEGILAQTCNPGKGGLYGRAPLPGDPGKTKGGTDWEELHPADL